MKIEFFKQFVPPKTTVQQRRQNKQGGYLHCSGRVAAATWKAVLEQHKPPHTIQGPIRITIALTWPHTARTRRIAAAVPKTTRPDGDNLIKMIKDIMTKLGYWNDDAQVYSETIERFYGEIPGVFVRIEAEEVRQAGGPRQPRQAAGVSGDGEVMGKTSIIMES